MTDKQILEALEMDTDTWATYSERGNEWSLYESYPGVWEVKHSPYEVTGTPQNIQYEIQTLQNVARACELLSAGARGVWMRTLFNENFVSDDIDQPKWDAPKPWIHEWKSHVPHELKKVWNQLSLESKYAAAFVCAEKADNERYD